MKKILYSLILLLLSTNVAFSQRSDLNPPLNFEASNPDQTDYAKLSWDEPIGTENLLGYNIYKDSLLIAFIERTNLLYFDLNLEPFINNIYYISALYNLRGGNPGDESDWVGPDTVKVIYCGCGLPFEEPFITGTLSTNAWSVDGNNWRISGEAGNSAPSAEFTNSPQINNYSQSLTSYWIDASLNTEDKILLDFDLKLVATIFSETEKLNVEVYNGIEWVEVSQFINSDNLDWHKEQIDITDIAQGIPFKIRFRAEGISTANISNWMIDNINVYADPETKTDNKTLSLISEIYPNPSSSFINLVFHTSVIKIELFNILGENLSNFEPVKDESMYQINVSKFKNGIYLIRLLTDSGTTEVRKVIIQH